MIWVAATTATTRGGGEGDRGWLTTITNVFFSKSTF
jgi:hypothetical protein